MPRQSIKGSTAGGSSAILGAPFWKKGKSVTGLYTRSWVANAQGKNIYMDEFIIVPPMAKIEATVGIDGKITEDGDGSGKKVTLEKFSMGGLKGYQIAKADIESQGYKLQVRDEVIITCSGVQDATSRDKDDMSLFEIEIKR